jgi:hypothetical protein
MKTRETMSEFTSPLTGKTYDVTYSSEFGWNRYNISLDGKWVQFALEAKDVAKSVANFEGVFDGWVTSAYD